MAEDKPSQSLAWGERKRPGGASRSVPELTQPCSGFGGAPAAPRAIDGLSGSSLRLVSELSLQQNTHRMVLC